MKKLLLSLMLIAGIANADTAAYLANKGNGQIVLTDTVCANYPTMFVAYSSVPNSTTLWGCWYSDDINVHIRWNDGDYRAYSLNANWYFYESVLRRMRKGGGI